MMPYREYETFHKVNNLADVEYLTISSYDVHLLADDSKASKIVSLKVVHRKGDREVLIPYLPSLKELFVDCAVADLSAYEKLESFRAIDSRTHASMRNVCIENISLSYGKITWDNINISVKSLYVKGSEPIPTGTLERLPCLTKLSISKIDMSTYDLFTIPDVESLAIKKANISDISFVRGRNNLKALNISDNDIPDLSPLEGLSLTKFSARNIKNNNFDVLRNMISLVKLSVHGNNLSDISFVEKLTNLCDLNIAVNDIIYIDILKNCRELVRLVMHDNPVFDIRVLNSLPKLWSLICYNSYVINTTLDEELADLKYYASSLPIMGSEITIDNRHFVDYLNKVLDRFMQVIKPSTADNATLCTVLGPEPFSTLFRSTNGNLKRGGYTYDELFRRVYTILETNKNSSAIINILKDDVEVSCPDARFYRTLCVVLPFINDFCVQVPNNILVHDIIRDTKNKYLELDNNALINMVRIKVDEALSEAC